MTDWLKEAQADKAWITSVYEDLHAHPEPGNQEYRTTGKLVTLLEAMGLEVKRPYETGCIAELKGSGTKTVAFRSDIDALPIREETGVSYASVNDYMHACGHDVHMSALLEAARLLSRHHRDLQGNIRFLFQMDEEGEGGAERLIRAGALDHVSEVYGCHINPSLPAGTIGIRYGRFYAAAMKFDIAVQGKSAHGAEPEKGIDALYAGSMLAMKLKELTGLYKGNRCVVTVGSFHAGKVRNILSDRAELSGIIRTPGLDLRAVLKQKFYETVEEVQEKTGTEISAHLAEGYPGVENEERCTAFVQQKAEEMLRKEHTALLEEPVMTTEDFGYYLQKVPGCFFHMGVGSAYPLHNSHMCPDERALPVLGAFEAYLLAEAVK